MQENSDSNIVNNSISQEYSKEYAIKYIELLRTEIMMHQRYLYGSTAVNVVAIPLFFSLSRNYDLQLFIVLSPLIVSVMMYFPLYYQVAIMRCGIYLRKHVETFLLRDKLVGYEQQLEQDNFGRVPDRFFFYLCAVAYSIYFLIALTLSYIALVPIISEVLARVLAGFALLIQIFVFVYWLRAWPIGTTVTKNSIYQTEPRDNA